MAHNPDCKRCNGYDVVKSWGTGHKEAPCPVCFPEAELKAVSLTEFKDQQAAAEHGLQLNADLKVLADLYVRVFGNEQLSGAQGCIPEIGDRLEGLDLGVKLDWLQQQVDDVPELAVKSAGWLECANLYLGPFVTVLGRSTQLCWTKPRYRKASVEKLAADPKLLAEALVDDPEAVQEAVEAAAAYTRSQVDRELDEKTIMAMNASLPHRQGWRFFACDQCGRTWRQASRDAASQSSETCTCTAEAHPEHYELDPTLPVDSMGNLLNSYQVLETSPAVDVECSSFSEGIAGVHADMVEVDSCAALKEVDALIFFPTPVDDEPNRGGDVFPPEPLGEPAGIFDGKVVKVEDTIARLKTAESRSRVSDEVLQELDRKQEQAATCEYCAKVTRACTSKYKDGYRCTRQLKHEGQHVACGGAHSIRVWD